jgi:hypothetical protein
MHFAIPIRHFAWKDQPLFLLSSSECLAAIALQPLHRNGTPIALRLAFDERLSPRYFRMLADLVEVRVKLDPRQYTILQFRREIYERQVAEARTAGVGLEQYLARKIIASGLGDVRMAESYLKPRPIALPALPAGSMA